jgi:glycosyltransferase involved in cell wall biosynthesis
VPPARLVKREAALSGPEVTVVIATRDRWEHLRDAGLPSALGQQGVELELVVVDDGSSDATPNGLARVDDARLRLVRSETSQGVSRARNRALAEARAPWVAFLDDDDLWSPLKLRAQLDAMRLARADYAYCAGVVVDSTGTPLRHAPAPDPDTVARALRASAVVGGPSSVIVSTELARRLGGFEPSLSVLADWDLWLRVARTGRAAACPEVLVAYREHGENMSAWPADLVFGELETLVERHGIDGEVDGVLFTHWVAANQRRAGRRLEAARAYLHGAIAFRSPKLLLRAVAMPLGERAMSSPERLRRARGRAEQPPSAPEWLRLPQA